MTGVLSIISLQKELGVTSITVTVFLAVMFPRRGQRAMTARAGYRLPQLQVFTVAVAPGAVVAGFPIIHPLPPVSTNRANMPQAF